MAMSERTAGFYSAAAIARAAQAISTGTRTSSSSSSSGSHAHPAGRTTTAKPSAPTKAKTKATGGVSTGTKTPASGHGTQCPAGEVLVSGHCTTPKPDEIPVPIITGTPPPPLPPATTPLPTASTTPAANTHSGSDLAVSVYSIPESLQVPPAYTLPILHMTGPEPEREFIGQLDGKYCFHERANASEDWQTKCYDVSQLTENQLAMIGDNITTPRMSVIQDVLRRRAADTAATGWRVGDPIENLTRAGNSPSWSTVRARYWKNAANDALEGEYSASNLARMEAGKPPLQDELGVPKELNHIVPRWQGGGHTLDNLEPLWPWEHAAVDPFRFYTGPTP